MRRIIDEDGNEIAIPINMDDPCVREFVMDTLKIDLIFRDTRTKPINYIMSKLLDIKYNSLNDVHIMVGKLFDEAAVWPDLCEKFVELASNIAEAIPAIIQNHKINRHLKGTEIITKRVVKEFWAIATSEKPTMILNVNRDQGVVIFIAELYAAGLVDDNQLHCNFVLLSSRQKRQKYIIMLMKKLKPAVLKRAAEDSANSKPPRMLEFLKKQGIMEPKKKSKGGAGKQDDYDFDSSSASSDDSFHDAVGDEMAISSSSNDNSIIQNPQPSSSNTDSYSIIVKQSIKSREHSNSESSSTTTSSSKNTGYVKDHKKPNFVDQFEKHMNCLRTENSSKFNMQNFRTCSESDKKKCARILLKSALDDANHSKAYAEMVLKILQLNIPSNAQCKSFNAHLKEACDLEIVNLSKQVKNEQVSWLFLENFGIFLSELYAVDGIKIQPFNKWLEETKKLATGNDLALKILMKAFRIFQMQMCKKYTDNYLNLLRLLREFKEKGRIPSQDAEWFDEILNGSTAVNIDKLANSEQSAESSSSTGAIKKSSAQLTTKSDVSGEFHEYLNKINQRVRANYENYKISDFSEATILACTYVFLEQCLEYPKRGSNYIALLKSTVLPALPSDEARSTFKACLKHTILDEMEKCVRLDRITLSNWTRAGRLSCCICELYGETLIGLAVLEEWLQILADAALYSIPEAKREYNAFLVLFSTVMKKKNSSDEVDPNDKDSILYKLFQMSRFGKNNVQARIDFKKECEEMFKPKENEEKSEEIKQSDGVAEKKVMKVVNSGKNNVKIKKVKPQPSKLVKLEVEEVKLDKAEVSEVKSEVSELKSEVNLQHTESKSQKQESNEQNDGSTAQSSKSEDKNQSVNRPHPTESIPNQSSAVKKSTRRTLKAASTKSQDSKSNENYQKIQEEINLLNLNSTFQTELKPPSVHVTDEMTQFAMCFLQIHKHSMETLFEHFNKFIIETDDQFEDFLRFYFYLVINSIYPTACAAITKELCLELSHFNFRDRIERCITTALNDVMFTFDSRTDTNDDKIVIMYAEFYVYGIITTYSFMKTLYRIYGTRLTTFPQINLLHTMMFIAGYRMIESSDGTDLQGFFDAIDNIKKWEKGTEGRKRFDKLYKLMVCIYDNSVMKFIYLNSTELTFEKILDNLNESNLEKSINSIEGLDFFKVCINANIFFRKCCLNVKKVKMFVKILERACELHEDLSSFIRTGLVVEFGIMIGNTKMDDDGNMIVLDEFLPKLRRILVIVAEVLDAGLIHFSYMNMIFRFMIESPCEVKLKCLGFLFGLIGPKMERERPDLIDNIFEKIEGEAWSQKVKELVEKLKKFRDNNWKWENKVDEDYFADPGRKWEKFDKKEEIKSISYNKMMYEFDEDKEARMKAPRKRSIFSVRGGNVVNAENAAGVGQRNEEILNSNLRDSPVEVKELGDKGIKEIVKEVSKISSMEYHRIEENITGSKTPPTSTSNQADISSVTSNITSIPSNPSNGSSNQLISSPIPTKNNSDTTTNSSETLTNSSNQPSSSPIPITNSSKPSTVGKTINTSKTTTNSSETPTNDSKVQTNSSNPAIESAVVETTVDSSKTTSSLETPANSSKIPTNASEAPTNSSKPPTTTSNPPKQPEKPKLQKKIENSTKGISKLKKRQRTDDDIAENLSKLLDDSVKRVEITKISSKDDDASLISVKIVKKSEKDEEEKRMDEMFKKFAEADKDCEILNEILNSGDDGVKMSPKLEKFIKAINSNYETSEIFHEMSRESMEPEKPTAKIQDLENVPNIEEIHQKFSVFNKKESDYEIFLRNFENSPESKVNTCQEMSQMLTKNDDIQIEFLQNVWKFCLMDVSLVGQLTEICRNLTNREDLKNFRKNVENFIKNRIITLQKVASSAEVDEPTRNRIVNAVFLIADLFVKDLISDEVLQSCLTAKITNLMNCKDIPELLAMIAEKIERNEENFELQARVIGLENLQQEKYLEIVTKVKGDLIELNGH